MFQDQQNVNSLNEELLMDESQASNSKNVRPYNLKFIPLIIGIIVVFIGIINMLTFFLIPYSKIQKNKKKFPNYSFDKPNKFLISIHFCLHFSIIVLGIFLILLSIGYPLLSFISFHHIEIFISASIIFIFWFIGVFLGFMITQDTKKKANIEKIREYLINESPANFAFVYSDDIITLPECIYNQKTGQYQCRERKLRCYSNKGVKIPLKSKLVSNPFDFSNTPELFYFNVEQVMNMSDEFSSKFNDIVQNINYCDEFQKVVDYYPLIAGSYFVFNGDFPLSLSHGTRVASILFGVGVYFELYSKSVPSINFKQYVNIELDPKCDYDNIWNDDSCFSYGECNINNDKPFP